MKTRKQYRDGECSHREYYAQFITDFIKSLVEKYIGLPELLASGDPFLNDIPIKKWDRIGALLPRSVTEQFRAFGDYRTAAGEVCIVKEAARQIIEKYKEVVDPFPTKK